MYDGLWSRAEGELMVEGAERGELSFSSSARADRSGDRSLARSMTVSPLNIYNRRRARTDLGYKAVWMIASSTTEGMTTRSHVINQAVGEDAAVLTLYHRLGLLCVMIHRAQIYQSSS